MYIYILYHELSTYPRMDDWCQLEKRIQLLKSIKETWSMSNATHPFTYFQEIGMNLANYTLIQFSKHSKE